VRITYSSLSLSMTRKFLTECLSNVCVFSLL
jgi:hypothetical protein